MKKKKKRMKKYKIIISTIFVSFVIFAAFSAYFNLKGLLVQKDNILQIQKGFKQVEEINNFMKLIQVERGITYIYMESFDPKLLKQLKQARLKTSLFYNTFLNIPKIRYLKNKIIFIRKQIDNKKFNQQETFKAYTKAVYNLIDSSLKLFLNTDNTKMKNYLIPYEKYNRAQEFLGELRAEIGGILERDKITQKQLNTIISTYALFNNYLKSANFFANVEGIKIYNNLKYRKCYNKTIKVIKNIINKNIPSSKLAPMQWFKISTCAVNDIYSLNNKYLKYLEIKLKYCKEDVNIKLEKTIIFWIIIIVFILILLFYLYKSNKQVFIEHNLLEEYKKAIDNSTLVSKTDSKGIITYVNDMFCKISGYTKEELIGKSHNIIRHPDMPKEVFKDLWKTIQNGKVWHGIVKNLKKNGDYYVVDATITPIFDHNGNIIEYIAIRHDITPIYELNQKIQTTQKELIYRISEAIESRSKETGNHVRRVAKYSYLLAKLYGFNEEECKKISIASTMHDVGKVAIPDSILLKPGKLTPEEWEIMKKHPAIGYHIFDNSKLPILRIAAQIAYEHHEKFDGTGYPSGKKGNEISIYAQIVSLVDVFDALISDRVYKKAWEYDKVIDLIKKERGKHFNPKLVDLFLKHIDEFMAIKKKYED